MKSHVRCILFALIAGPAVCGMGCGGDRSTSSASSAVGSAGAAGKPGNAHVATQAVAPPAAPPAGPAKLEPAKLAAAAPVVPAGPPSTVAEALQRGKSLAAAGDPAAARQMFEAAIKLDRKAVDPHIELARLFIAGGERGPAMRAASKAVQLAPGSSHAHNTLGRAELARFNYDGAIVAFTRATELAADNAWAWNNLGYTYLQLERYQDAADALVRATAIEGAESYMWNNLGTAYEHLDQLDEARAAFEAGGTLGSKQALASRKRLEGVATIVVVRADPPDVREPGAPPILPSNLTEQGYELSEPMPDVAPAEAAEEPETEADADHAAEDASAGMDRTEKDASPEALEVDDEPGGDAREGVPPPAREAPPAPRIL